MSRQVDSMYNTNLSLGTSKSTDGKENMLPQRIPQRSKFNCSPYDVVTTKFTNNSSHHKVWEAVTTIGDVESETST
jgi:hypothetical protein